MQVAIITIFMIRILAIIVIIINMIIIVIVIINMIIIIIVLILTIAAPPTRRCQRPWSPTLHWTSSVSCPRVPMMMVMMMMTCYL